jgi:adenylate cyclase
LGVAIGSISGVAVSALAALGVFDGLEHDTFDVRARVLQDPARADSSIVIVAVDDNSIEAFRRQLGRWPWPRDAHAQLLAYLTAAGARLTIFDVSFPEPDPLRPASDSAFAHFIAENGRVVLPLTVQPGDSAEAAVWERDLGLEGRRAAMERFAVGAARAAPGAADFPFAEPPDPLFLEPAAQIGTILLNADGDGVTRRSVPVYPSRGLLYPNLALAAARALQPARFDSPVLALTDEGLRLENGTALALDGGTLVLRWHGRYLREGESTYRIHRAADVLLSYNQVALGERTPENADVPFSALRDRVVFVATTAVGTFEPRPTPLAPNDPGVMIHATTLDNYLNDDFLRRAPRSANAAAALVPALLASVAVLALPSATLGALGTLVLLGMVALFGLWTYSSGVWLDVAAPLFATALSFAGVMSVNYFTEGRERRRVKEMFSRYVSPLYVSSLADHYETLRLGGERVPLTVLFSDIRGFTAMSERLPPDTVISTLNQYLEHMSAVVFRNGGTLDKFIGDAVMAFWGAPIHVEDHVRRALDTALEMMEELHALNRRWAVEGRPALDIGIGVNTGEAIVGNIGSLAHKLDYTAIGDTVNVASRLEGLNKELGTHILVSEATVDAAGDAYEFRPLPDTKVKGKENLVRIFELTGRTPDRSRAAPGTARPAATAITLALLALGLGAAAVPLAAQGGGKERWVDNVYQPGRWSGRQLVPHATTNPATDTLALVARVDAYVRQPRWRAEVRRMTPGDSTAQLTVLVGDGADVVVLTAVGSTPFAQHQASSDELILSVVQRFEGGRPARPQEGGRFVERGANNNVTRVVTRSTQARGDFADALLETSTGSRALGLAVLGVQTLAPGRNQEIVASAGPRGAARVRTASGEIVVTPDAAAVTTMRQRSVEYFDLDAFLKELRLGVYRQPAGQEERR